MFDGKARAAHSLHDLVMQAAWTSGSIPRLKKIPKLKSLLIGKSSKPKQQSWQDLYAVAQAWAAESGQILSPEVAA